MIDGEQTPEVNNPKKHVPHLKTGPAFQLILLVAALKRRCDKIVERTD